MARLSLRLLGLLALAGTTVLSAAPFKAQAAGLSAVYWSGPGGNMWNTNSSPYDVNSALPFTILWDSGSIDGSYARPSGLVLADVGPSGAPYVFGSTGWSQNRPYRRSRTDGSPTDWVAENGQNDSGTGYRIAISPDATRLYHIDTGNQIRAYETATDPASTPLWSIDGDGGSRGIAKLVKVGPDGRIYGHFNGTTALDPADGAVIWESEGNPENALMPGAFFDTGSFVQYVVAGTTNTISAYDISSPSGSAPIWTYADSESGRSGPTIDPITGDIYVFRSTRVIKLTSSGTFLWGSTPVGVGEAGYSYGALSRDGGTFYYQTGTDSNQGKVYAFTTSDGAEKWVYQTNARRRDDCGGPVVSGNDLIFVANAATSPGDNKLFCIKDNGPGDPVLLDTFDMRDDGGAGGPSIAIGPDGIVYADGWAEPDDKRLFAFQGDGTSADCNSNGVSDEVDLAGGTSSDCNGNGVPDECDIAGGTGTDCNTNGVPDECDVAGGISQDCNSNGIPDDCDIADGPNAHDCCAEHPSPGCSDATISACVCGFAPSCCSSGWNATCAVLVELLACGSCPTSSSGSPDCDYNSVPDECQPDCNSNGVPDTCDIAEGTSQDCNTNGVLDECDVMLSKAMVFDGSNDWVNIPDFVLDGDFAIEAWVYLVEPISAADALVGQEGQGQDINFHTGRMRLSGSPEGDWIIANTPIVPDTWTHCAIVRTGGYLYLYLNGMIDATGVSSGEFVPKAIGRGHWGYFGGMLDEVRLWNVARTPEQILNAHTRIVAPDTLGLIGRWAFQEDDGDQNVIDSSSQNNHGTIGFDLSVASDDPARTESMLSLPPNEDCNNNGVPDGCDVDASDPDGDGWVSGDANSNGIPDECEELDCNSNGQLDFMEIAADPNADCNTNGIVDDCEVAWGMSTDCDENSVLDECEGFTASGSVLYVDKTATGQHDGSSWANAYTEVRMAMCVAEHFSGVTEVRVAGATYAPAPPGDARSKSFRMVSSVGFQGGYAGSANPGNPDARDPAVYETILTGDLNGNDSGWDNRLDNSRHVVTAYQIGNTAVMEGFTITGGNATGGSTKSGLGGGGGLEIRRAAPTIIDCNFTRNRSSERGAASSAMRAYDGDDIATFRDCVFLDNWTDGEGGAIAVDRARSLVDSSRFFRNKAGIAGGAMWHHHSPGPIMINDSIFVGNNASAASALFTINEIGRISNCAFVSNHAESTTAAAIAVWLPSTPTFTNCIVSGNTNGSGGGESAQMRTTGYESFADDWIFYSLVESWTGMLDTNGVGNFGADPLFVRDPSDGGDGWNIGDANDDFGDLHLLLGSPANDAGDNTAVPLDIFDANGDGDFFEPNPFDLGGGRRFREDPTTVDTGVISTTGLPNVDLGAFETSDCNNNGVTDWLDILDGTSSDADSNGVPDECFIWDDEQGDNNWSTALNWENDAVPGVSGAGLKEAVIIDLPGSNVLLDVPASVDSVIIGDATTLNITGLYDLTIDAPNGIRNNGTIDIGNGRSLFASTATVFRGERPITLSDAAAAISSVSPGDTITNTGAIAGKGILDADLHNQGTVLADFAGGTLSVEGANSKINDGVFGATSNGLLSIVTDVTGDGNLQATAQGTLSISGVTVNNYSLMAREGSIAIDNATVTLGNGIDEPPGVLPLVSGQLDIFSSDVYGTDGHFVSDGVTTLGSGSLLAIADGPVLLCPDLIADPTAVAELHITDAASRVSATDLDMCTNAVLEVVGTLSLADSFTFTNTQPGEWSWGASSVLEMTGGVGLPETDPTGYGRLEVGGQDFGDDPATHAGNPAGFVDNFQLQELSIGPGAHVMLVDFVDNGNRGGVGGQAEALYVDTLRFVDSNGHLNLGGLHLYYNTVIQPGGAGQLLDCPPGDAECDGDVDVADFAGFQTCAGREPVSPACARYDLDEDGDVDAEDYTIFAQSLSGPQSP